MKQHRLKLWLLSPIFLLPTSNLAQTTPTYDPYTPESLPDGVPTWMLPLGSRPSEVNYTHMDSLFRQWLATDVNARVKTVERKPVVNFFRRWAKAYRPYVRTDGSIRLPTFDEYLARLDAHNAPKTRASRAASSSGRRWRNIGPNQTYASSDQGLQQKDAQACVYRIAVSSADPEVAYCGTETGVVFKTTNKGKSWTACRGEHDFGGPIFAVQVSPFDKNIVYVGGGQNLWMSTDGGASWTRHAQVRSRVNSIRFNPVDARHITLCAGLRNDSEGGFYVSNDGGVSFRRTLNGIAHDHEVQPGNANRQYVLIRPSGEPYFSLHVSEDGGNSFSKITLPVSNICAGRLAVSQAPGGDNYLYALVTCSTWDAGGEYGGKGVPYLLKSVDAGRTWQDQTVRDASKSWENTFSPILDDTYGGQGFFDMTLGVSSENPEHVIYGLCSAYRSTEGGKGSFRKTAIGGYQRLDWMHPDIQDIAVVGKDTWIATDGGIKYSADFFATKGENRHSGIYASDYHGFGQGWNEDVMAGGRWHNGDAVHSAGYGEGNILHVGGVEYPTGHVMLSRSRKVYFSDHGTSIMPETLSGRVTTTYDDISKKPYETLRTNGEIAFDPRYARRFMMSSREENGELFLTEDEGRTFRRILDTEGEQICSYAFARSNPDYIYVAGAYDVYCSTDGGSKWTTFATRPFNVVSGAGVATALAIDPHDERKVWLAYSNEPGCVAYTVDGGRTWTHPLSSQMKNRTFQWIILVGDERNGVYLGTVDGASVFYKDDTLSDWIDYSDGLNPGARLTRLVPFYKEGKLRAATNQGIWEIPLYREHFRPVAQPMALNIGHGDLTANPQAEIQLDSYSIVNQKNATWEWSFHPQPEFVSDIHARNPRVRFGHHDDFDVTLKIKTLEGEHTRTMRRMVRTSNTPTSLVEGAIQPTIKVMCEDGCLRIVASGMQDDLILTVHNIKGALLQRSVLPAHQKETKVDLEHRKTGAYIYELRGNGFKQFGKFLLP